MARSKKELNVLNVQITLGIGKGRNYWTEPNVTRYENFEMPIEMFDAKKLAEVISGMIADIPKELAEATAELEAKQKAEAEEALKLQEAENS